ncbi:hypothetical protein [Hippea maritima]|uniref:Uncharacterized protein n=1 Tax=Hippea maritima (strain ATCC 700847 / DSM 10411 / MH2) TaxID=760142 RepID=F2LXR0_HIPMA|nr:hypothetical protein [Hippea maritima]AEA34301.1 hypothetical protein Hipma_1345 [Hippea maritima DSM 10411]
MDIEWETYFYSKTEAGKLMTKKNDPPPRKYFKIVNPNGHYGVFYTEGINEDSLPFNPDPYGEAGGIYFAAKDIFSFIDKGEDVYEVKPFGWVTKTKCRPKIFKAHRVQLRYLGKIWDTATLQYIIAAGADISSYLNKTKSLLSGLNKQSSADFLSSFQRKKRQKQR